MTNRALDKVSALRNLMLSQSDRLLPGEVVAPLEAIPSYAYTLPEERSEGSCIPGLSPAKAPPARLGELSAGDLEQIEARFERKS